MNETRVYTNGQVNNGNLSMPKYINESLINFGQRLATLRKDAGYTQQELADQVGVTRRMIAYYETESEHLPASLLIELAVALNISTDQLLGVKTTAKKKVKPSDSRLQRRFKQIEKMGAKEKRQIVQLLDTFIEREQLKQAR